jgi:hypothetical protein
MAGNGINSHTDGANGSHGDRNGINGTNETSTTYSIPKETQKVFEDGILKNPLIASTLPKDIKASAKTVRFEGTDSPSLPIN